MIFKTKTGTKHPDDRILQSLCCCCEVSENLLLNNLLHWVRLQGEIEDILYPTGQGFDGRWLLLKFISDGLMKKDGVEESNLRKAINQVALACQGDERKEYLYTISEICRKFNLNTHNVNEDYLKDVGKGKLTILSKPHDWHG